MEQQVEMLCYCLGYESEFDAEEDFLIFEWMAHRSWVHAFQKDSFRKTNGQNVS